jgi:chromate reductase, NAD(P)H dehydrogenase (quinone)
MKKILAFAGSTHSRSINQQAVKFLADHVKNHEVTLIELRDFPLPVFSLDEEQRTGIPENANRLRQLIATHDAFIIAVAEHNNSVTAAFKNSLDWLSRSSDDYRVLAGKPVLLLSTSPGAGGGRNALLHAEHILSILDGNILAKMYIPDFFSRTRADHPGLQVTDERIRVQLLEALSQLELTLSYKPNPGKQYA